MSETVDDLIRLVAGYMPPKEVKRVKRALAFAETHHQGQMRQSGEPYLTHPIQVAIILAGLQQDCATVCAGLLHDTVEDTDVDRDDVAREFGDDVATLVDGVTKLGKIQFKSKEEAAAENFRKMFLAMANDLRVVIIKLADRVHNMRTLKHLPPEKRIRIAQETRDIFSPLAHRLGMWKMKWELEDLAFYYLEPDEFQHIKTLVSSARAEREQYVNDFIKTITGLLHRVGVDSKVAGRPKHFYSIHQKLKKYGLQFDELFDTLGVRVIVSTIKECYEVLGIIHSEFIPISGRFKDYIAMPKSNMYQSLHTTVIGPKGKPVEIQIRTHDMHQLAEYGVAAHWRYKEGNVSKGSETEFAWLRQMIEVQQEKTAPKEFFQNLKLDLFIDEVFVFTPNGDVLELPKGATPVDFAYRIHTEIGNSCVGAKVNSHIVPLNYELHNGDRIEILTQKNAKPNIDWLNFVKTNQAKDRIKQWVRRKKSGEMLEKGTKKLEKLFINAGIAPASRFTDRQLQLLIKAIKVKTWDEVFIRLANSEITSKEVFEILYPPEVPKPAQPAIQVQQRPAGSKRNQDSDIEVLGQNQIQVRLAKCCNPLPGDRIVGYVTIGAGVSIHRDDCTHVGQLKVKAPERMILVEWGANAEAQSYMVGLELEAFNRVGLLQDIVQVVSDLHLNITEIRSKMIKKTGTVEVLLSVEVKEKQEVNKLTERLRGLSDVVDVRRTVKKGK